MERFFEFILNHPLNVATFLAMVALLVFYESRQRGKSLSPSDLVKEINDNKALVVDLRPDTDFRAGHIVSAINMPYAKISELPALLKKHPDRSTILVCANGRNSTAAQNTLKKAGVAAARLSGGLLEWHNANMPLTKGAAAMK